jgi:hypothetical protein
MSETMIGVLVLLCVLGLVIAWALVRGGARCDGYTDDPDNWRADGERDAGLVLPGQEPSSLAVWMGRIDAELQAMRAGKPSDRALSDAELQALSAGDNPQWLPKEGRA